MRFGLGLPQMGHFDPARDVVDVARAAESAGYEGVWVYERILFPVTPSDGLYRQDGVPWPDVYRSCADPLVTLSIAAAVTERVRLGTSVLVAPLHTPVQLARQLATLDRISGGRVVAGLGSGWSTDEFLAAGADFTARGRALEETIEVCRAVWGADPVSVAGQHTAIDEAVMGPKPAGPIPVHLGAQTDRALDRVARIADGWVPALVSWPALAERWTRLLELAAGYGRDGGTIDFTVRARVTLSDGPIPDAGRAPFHGSLEQVVVDVATAEEIGAREVLFELQGGSRDAAELIDKARLLREALRATGF